MLKERFDLEKSRTKHINHKLLSLMRSDFMCAEGFDEQEYKGLEKITQMIAEKCSTESEYEIADTMLTGIQMTLELRERNLQSYLDRIADGDRCGFVWDVMCEKIFERAADLELVEHSYDIYDSEIYTIKEAVEAFGIDTDKWLDSSDEDFTYNIRGIFENYKEPRERPYDCRILNGFIPKYSRLDEMKYYVIKLPPSRSKKKGVIVFSFVPNGTKELAVKQAMFRYAIGPDDLETMRVKEHSLEEIQKIGDTTKMYICEC